MPEEEVFVGSVRTICPSCEMSYQRPVTAKELHKGGAVKVIMCGWCRKNRERREAARRSA